MRIWASSVRRWMADLVAGHGRAGLADSELPLTGRGGATGTPSHDLDEAPPSLDQEANQVVSGGGVVGDNDREGPSHKAKRSR